MTQAETPTTRTIHITDQSHISSTCNTLCEVKADFTACLTIDQYKEFDKLDQIDPDEWCEECSTVIKKGGLFYFQGIPPKDEK